MTAPYGRGSEGVTVQCIKQSRDHRERFLERSEL